jgi:predicted PurR-regulated permease PerM
VILLLLALTFAAAIRPGVEWLERRRVPQAAAILVFFLGALAAVALFC